MQAEDHMIFLQGAPMKHLSFPTLSIPSLKEAKQSGRVGLYTPELGLGFLKSQGTLSVLSIHTQDFRNIGIEYGKEAFQDLHRCFEETLISLWGASGSFRSQDILCRNPVTHSGQYFVLIAESRADNPVPKPSSIERMADRLTHKLENLLWQELLKPSPRRLPTYLKQLPRFKIGYATAVYNPCLPPEDTLENLFEASRQVAEIQRARHLLRHRELMTTIIQTQGILRPVYQGIFETKSLTIEGIQKAQKEQSLAPLKESLYGFESLIRIQSGELAYALGRTSLEYLEAHYFRPDILFDLARQVQLALELDQCCFREGIRHAKGLPGRLFVNLLPRNFYSLELLSYMIPEGLQITFEISETEAINNYGLLRKVCEGETSQKFEIAIDDFGQGYAGLDRLLQINPQVIKLDRSLVHQLGEDLSRRAFVEGMIKAARTTNALILAEGVETIQEFKALRDLNVDLIQGFLVHRPQFAEEIKF